MSDFDEWLRAQLERQFNEWASREFPDGMGNGTGGAYHQDDMRAAFMAGYDLRADEE